MLSVPILTVAMLASVQAQGSAASISIVKEPDQTVVSGSVATFTITITNTGDLTLTNVTVSDALAPNCTRVFEELTAGENEGYVCTVTNVVNSFTNSATVTGTPALSDTEVTDTDTAVVTVIHPDIQIAKTPDTQMIASGSTVTFTIAVTNTGDVTLTGVTVSDALAPNCARAVGLLSPGASTRYGCTCANVLADFTNSATATGTPRVGDDVSDTDTAFVDVISPSIEIAKTPERQTVVSGSTASFSIAVTNTGDVALTNVTVSDVQAPNCVRVIGNLAPGGSARYGCTLASVTDGFINTATVTGRPPMGESVNDSDSAIVILSETQTCPAGMSAYWRLDETSGAVYDDFYNGHDGQCAGQCPIPAVGHLNGGQAFDGSHTGVDVPAVPGDGSFNWGAGDSFSIEFWMKADGPNSCSLSNEVIVGRDDSAHSQLHWWVGLGCWAGGKVAFILRDTSGVIGEVVGTTQVTDGSWHHIVAIRDASQNENRIYVDGIEEDSASVTYSTGFASMTAMLNIGWLYRSHGYHFDGIVDEVVLYDAALAADEIRQHHSEGLAGRWYCQAGTFAPLIVSTSVTEATVGRPYSYDVEAAGNPDPTYELVVYPAGMTIAPATGVVSWLPTLGQEGSHPVEVEASNSEGIDTQNFTVVVSAGTICPADMIAYWKLGETSGSTYDDFFDGHDGTCADQCPTPTTGHTNGGQDFNGADTGIDVPADEDFDWGSTDDFSIEFWLQTASASTCAGNEVVIGRDDSSTNLHWWVGCQDGGEAAFYLIDTSGTMFETTGTRDLTDGNWHHVVAVRDASTNQIRLYVDGVEEDAQSATYTTGFGSPVAALNIGWLNLSHGYHFDGILDEVALYDRILSASEIQQHYSGGGTGPGYCINPDIAVNKTANSSVAYIGDVVTYTYTVTNPGDDPLLVMGLSDDRCSPVTFVGGDGDSDNRLDPAETWSYRCSMTLNTDITNTVTVTGTYSLDGTVGDTDTVSVRVINPEIAISKVANLTFIQAGDTVTYTYTVTNTGDDPLSSMGVSDDKCSPVRFVEGDNNDNYLFDPGEIWTYTCSTVLSADTTNTAIAMGTDSAGGIVSDADTAFVDVEEQYWVFLPIVLRD
jgi:uncharacterized repeat protein (TIGR01451 family)